MVYHTIICLYHIKYNKPINWKHEASTLLKENLSVMHQRESKAQYLPKNCQHKTFHLIREQHPNGYNEIKLQLPQYPHVRSVICSWLPGNALLNESYCANFSCSKLQSLNRLDLSTAQQVVSPPLMITKFATELHLKNSLKLIYSDGVRGQLTLSCRPSLQVRDESELEFELFILSDSKPTSKSSYVSKQLVYKLWKIPMWLSQNTSMERRWNWEYVIQRLGFLVLPRVRRLIA